MVIRVFNNAVAAGCEVQRTPNPPQPPMNRTVTLPADGGGVWLALVESKSPRRHSASARALEVQPQSLVWPVTASGLTRGQAVP
jgi:hypothetical protein